MKRILLPIVLIVAMLQSDTAHAAATSCGAAFYGSISATRLRGGGGKQSGAQPPQIENPVSKVCENGNMAIEARIQPPAGDSPRHFAYRSGDVIVVVVTVTAQNGIRIDTTTLTEQHVINFEGSPFVLADEPEVVVTRGLWSHSYQITLKLQAFAAPPFLPFEMDLRYALARDASGGVDRWQRLSTPTLYITFSPTADHAERLLPGDLLPAAIQHPATAGPLVVGGALMLSVTSAIELIWLIMRRRPGRVPAPNEASWLVFDRELTSTNRLSPANYDRVSLALRTYLGAKSGSIAEIKERYSQDARLPFIEEAFELLNRGLYRGEKLDFQQNVRVLECLERIVPRPFDPRT